MKNRGQGCRSCIRSRWRQRSRPRSPTSATGGRTSV